MTTSEGIHADEAVCVDLAFINVYLRQNCFCLSPCLRASVVGVFWSSVWSEATSLSTLDKGEAGLRAAPAVSGALTDSTRSKLFSGLERSDIKKATQGDTPESRA
jgi:hypothetical protein